MWRLTMFRFAPWWINRCKCSSPDLRKKQSTSWSVFVIKKGSLMFLVFISSHLRRLPPPPPHICPLHVAGGLNLSLGNTDVSSTCITHWPWAQIGLNVSPAGAVLFNSLLQRWDFLGLKSHQSSQGAADRAFVLHSDNADKKKKLYCSFWLFTA